MLYLVPTPIGNLEDMTFRAVKVLKEVSLILAEDTRTSRTLLNHYDIHTPLQAHHLFNEHQTVMPIVERLKCGEDLALITDAGTPAISDPGFLLVRECVKNGIEVRCLPGATAFVPALVCSALACERFCFEGFLPHKKGRQSKLEALKNETRTMIFYESPHRINKTLEQFCSTFGTDRPASLSREISKKFEETARGTLQELYEKFKGGETKGEIVIVVGGMEKESNGKSNKKQKYSNDENSSSNERQQG
ncbi:MAG TPA: 16S rRNA (cytidine(1402)-2'-O)-methyltransferase [Candidatus Onthomorpha intestinigallinarum]|uniref:Ribosomal RNA small subunit methyltransferase I n=1 Tax=Candidatus Onthomorpha intestinigallinarum TaxID=2840880 RepID=A0A9D1RGJ1_9BACT|nr:16S rRNA (cytidine(1402)-2'-O)-methyltransferase [Candidatus Onthomorpha intestinigallinarum]